MKAARPTGFHLITDEIVEAMPELSQIKIGFLQVFMQHTSREGRQISVKHGDDYFPKTWDVINAKRGLGWKENPWVWVIEFKILAQG